MFKVAEESLVGLKIKDYTFLRLIGKGNYGSVYEVFREGSHESAAAKVMPKEIFKKTPKLMELVKTEIRVLKECHNENVVRYVDNFMTERSIVIVMEYCDGGQLQGYLAKKGRLTEHEATLFLKQILNGFKGLHEVQAMHRDFKAANVLLQNGVCKIADLGFAKQVKEESMTNTVLGTGLTMAPEVHQERAYGRKADIWSVGVVFYQLIYGDYPFKGLSDHDILLKIKKTRPDYGKVNISERAKDFIERCLTVDPKARISWKDVYSHPLIVEEQKVIYSMTSSLRLQENQIFYDRDSVPSGEVDVEVEEGKEKEKEKVQVQVVKGKGKGKEQGVKQKEEKEEWTPGQQWTKGEEQAVQAAVLQSLRAQREWQGRMQQGVKEWQQGYLLRRNAYMFIFKEMVPCILRIYKRVHANHIITLFILCKRAYHDLTRLAKQLAKGENFLGRKEYFAQFLASKQYRQLCEQVESDCTLIRMQTQEYSLILPSSLNGPTENQLDIETIASNNWIAFVEDTVACYEDELVGGLDATPAELKQDVIKLVEGLHYYRVKGEAARLEEFDKYMQGQSYEEAELRLRERWSKKLAEFQQ